jgi:hypothetical protein
MADPVTILKVKTSKSWKGRFLLFRKPKLPLRENDATLESRYGLMIVIAAWSIFALFIVASVFFALHLQKHR